MPKATHSFENRAGKKYNPRREGMYEGHKITLTIKDGSSTNKVTIQPGARYDYTAKTGVTEIEVKSDVTGWHTKKQKMQKGDPTKTWAVYIQEDEDEPASFRVRMQQV